MKGTIFDIRRFSTHDGSGIRTTIFLKGCSLKCVWCQNPEGISMETLPVYFENICVGCKNCLRHAKNNGVYQSDGKIKIKRDADENWKDIVENCPSTALRIDSKKYEVKEVVREVLKDKVFFKHGGGITLSGGEPLLQCSFSIELLKRLKEININTSIETALNIDVNVLKNAVKYLDIIYADLKIFDEKIHAKYVGASNTIIKKNIEFLLRSPYKDRVIIRTPLIPEYTATKNNIGSIAKFISDIYSEVKYELLNYNPLAEAKYGLLNKEYCFKKNPKLYTDDEMMRFGEIARKNGIKNLI